MACLNVGKTESYVHDDGNTTYIYGGRSWTYRVNTGDGTKVASNMVVYLSYAGLLAGTQFNAPTKVTIKAGQSSVDFEIYIVRDPASYGMYLNVAATSEYMPSCGCARNQVLCEVKEAVYEGCPECDPHCCDFFDENYEGWQVYESKGCPDFFKETPMLF